MSIITHSHPAGKSPLERLPTELLRKILIFVALNPTSDSSSQFSIKIQDRSPNIKASEPATSLPCLLTSRTLHMTALPVTYRDITTTLPSTFTKFLAQLRCHPKLGLLVRTLDLSPAVTSNPRPENEVLANPLPGLLLQTPLLREFRISPSLQDHLTGPFLHQLFSELRHLESIDLSLCNSSAFAWEFGQLCTTPDFVVSNSITSLNLNGCENVASHVFDTLLPHLPKPVVLEAAGTQISTQALSHIPSTARLTHLNLHDCPFLSSTTLTTFLRTHPSAKTLEILDLGTSIENRFLIEEDVSSILASLPPSVYNLNLKNSNMTALHIPLLRRLAGQLEDLTVGSHLHMRDLEAIFLDPEELPDVEEEGEEEEVDNEVQPQADCKYATILDPMEEAVAICKLRRRISTFSSSYSSSTASEGQSASLGAVSQIKNLDISSMTTGEQRRIMMSILLGPMSGVLQRIELSEKVVRRTGLLKRVARAVGWDIGGVGRRFWVGRKLLG